MAEIYEFGLNLIEVLQTLSPALDGVMAFLSFLGTIEFFLLLIPFLYWLVKPELGMRVLLVLITVDLVGSYFKVLLHEPRPYWVGDVQALSTETSYGIPSTHASNSLAVWAFLGYWFRQRWLWVVGLSLAFLISLSRLYLGVHFPQDVLGGWLIGLMVLALLLWGEKRLLPRLQAYSLRQLLGLSFAASLLFLLVGLLVTVIVAGTPDPSDWAEFALEARTPAHFYTVAGALLGATVGFVLMRLHAPFDPAGSLGQKGLRYLVGIIGVLVLWQGLDILFGLLAPDESAFGYILRYLRYAATTVWATFGAPWVFVRSGLASRGLPFRVAAQA